MLTDPAFQLALCPVRHLVLVLFSFAAHISLAGGNIDVKFAFRDT